MWAQKYLVEFSTARHSPYPFCTLCLSHGRQHPERHPFLDRRQNTGRCRGAYWHRYRSSARVQICRIWRRFTPVRWRLRFCVLSQGRGYFCRSATYPSVGSVIKGNSEGGDVSEVHETRDWRERSQNLGKSSGNLLETYQVSSSENHCVTPRKGSNWINLWIWEVLSHYSMWFSSDVMIVPNKERRRLIYKHLYKCFRWQHCLAGRVPDNIRDAWHDNDGGGQYSQSWILVHASGTRQTVRISMIILLSVSVPFYITKSGVWTWTYGANMQDYLC